MQERQRAASGADEHEARAHGMRLAGIRFAHGEFPVGTPAVEIGDAMSGEHAAILLLAQPSEEAAGEFTEIHIGAGGNARGGDRLGSAAR